MSRKKVRATVEVARDIKLGTRYRHCVYLSVGNDDVLQTFEIAVHNPTKKRAEWYAKMLRKALRRLTR